MISPKKTILRHVIVKTVKIKGKERILKAARKSYYVEEKPHKAISRFFNRNFMGPKRVAWNIQGTERKKFPAIILNLTRLSFRIGGKSFQDKQKIKVFIITKLAPQETLRGIL